MIFSIPAFLNITHIFVKECLCEQNTLLFLLCDFFFLKTNSSFTCVSVARLFTLNLNGMHLLHGVGLASTTIVMMMMNE